MKKYEGLIIIGMFLLFMSLVTYCMFLDPASKFQKRYQRDKKASEWLDSVEAVKTHPVTIKYYGSFNGKLWFRIYDTVTLNPNLDTLIIKYIPNE